MRLRSSPEHPTPLRLQGGSSLFSLHPCAHRTRHYEGEKNAERKARCVLPEGDVFYFEGEKGAERKVRCVRPWGDVFDYEGEQGAEQMVRLGLPFGFSMQPWSTVTTVDNLAFQFNLVVATAYARRHRLPSPWSSASSL